jgi:hypothetical protein
MSYLRYMCLLGLSFPPVVCRRAHVLFTLYVLAWFVFTNKTRALLQTTGGKDKPNKHIKRI